MNNIILSANKFKKKLDEFKMQWFPSGKNIMICCPFHADSSPSLGVHFGKGVFNCRGCGEHGSILKLLKTLFVKSDLSKDEDEEYEGEEKTEEYDEKIKSLLDRVKNIDSIKKEKTKIKVRTNFDFDKYPFPYGEYESYLIKRIPNKGIWELFD